MLSVMVSSSAGRNDRANAFLHGAEERCVSSILVAAGARM